MSPELQDKSTQILVTMARNKVRQMLYDARITATSHFWAETKGTRKLKPAIVEEKLTEKFKLEDYMAVSTLSFYSMFILNCIIYS